MSEPTLTPNPTPAVLHELPTTPARLDVQSLFAHPAPLEIEIGSGKGLFLTSAGVDRPGRNFLGVEIVKKYAKKGAERIAKSRLTNVAMLRADVRQLWELADGLVELEAVHIYFPDPWWKKRHKKRRVFDADFVARVSRALKDTGEFHIATDVEEYFHTMCELVATRPEFVQLPEIPNVVGDFTYLTNFERKYRIEGRPIYRTAYRLDRLAIQAAMDTTNIADA